MVEFVEYKGKKFPFVYNYYTISRLQGIANKVEDSELFDYLVFYSLEAGCDEMDIPFTIKKGDNELDFSVKDAAFMIGKLGVDTFNEMIKKFTAEESEAKKKKS